ncbi:MAG: serine/threonine-protein kinase [Kofleriaceae bacterium]
MDLIGWRFGSYVAQRRLGAGGMGTVYLCQHTLIDRQVAVKVLHDEQSLDPEQVDRFFQEARSAAEIGHPNIIVIIDAGYVATPQGQRAYIMMEALDGDSLDKRIHAGGLGLADIHHVMSQCAAALTASHGKGIIHRDLKPANIFLCHHPFDPIFVKVLDFGIAKLTTPDANARKTQLGIVLGTPAYMSPEQCEGKGAIDHRSDVYSLGVVLYEMLTGTVPFDGDIRDILLAHLRQPAPPPRTRNPSIPPAWEALCLRMLEIHKEARPQSMQEVAAALADLDRHAAMYAAAQARRAASGHSGHTQIAPRPDGVPAAVVDAGSRPTLHAQLDDLPPPVSGWPAASGAGAAPDDASGSVRAAATVPHPTGAIAIDAIAHHCGALVTEHRFDAFPDFLLRQSAGEWLDVGAVCSAVGVARPPAGADVRVAWLEHPYRDARLASIVFFCPATLWSAVLVHRRPT